MKYWIYLAIICVTVSMFLIPLLFQTKADNGIYKQYAYVDKNIPPKYINGKKYEYLVFATVTSRGDTIEDTKAYYESDLINKMLSPKVH